MRSCLVTAPALVAMDESDRERWDTFVADSPFGHVFQSWAWGDLQKGLGAQPVRIAAVAPDGRISGCVQALVFDTGSRVFAYVPRGPVVDPDDVFLRASLVDAVVGVSEAAGADLVRLEPQWEWSPTLAEWFEQRRFAAAPQHIMPPRTIVVDLTPSSDAIWNAFRSNTRNRIRLAEKRGVTVRVGTAEDMATFVRLLDETNARHGLRPGRPDQYYLAAQHFGDGHRMRLFLASAAGVDLAGIVVFAWGSTATYLWGASAGSDEARQLNPNQLLHWAAMQWARKRGCLRYDLFGVPDHGETVLEAEYGRQTGGWWNLYRFKRGFGGRVHRHLGTLDYLPPAPAGTRVPAIAETPEEVRVTERALAPGVLADRALLTPSEAAEAVRQVHAAREHWTRRHPGYPVYSLGAASYLDGPTLGFAGYQAEARRLNPVLAARFGWLHERLRAAVSSLVGAEAAYDDRVALPGFHVYLSDPTQPQPVASVHYDMQYDQIDWSGWGTPDRERQLSVTIALALPAAGGGLLVWNINRLAIERMSADEPRAHTAANRDAEYHAYTVGHLAVHSGHQLHQIAPTKDVQPGDERITMQAHAIPVNGRWLIYW